MEAVCTVATCREDLAKCQDELKEVGEMVKCHEGSILETEKEKEHAWSERNKRLRRHCTNMKGRSQRPSERGIPSRSTWLELGH